LCALFRPRGDDAYGLYRKRVVGGGVDARLLCGPFSAGCLDAIWRRAAHALRAHPLGRNRDCDRVERLYGRRSAVRPAGGARGIGAPSQPIEYPGYNEAHFRGKESGVMGEQSAAVVPDARGRFGEFGGRFVPETIIPALDELAAEY